jgi:hypothetical protein
MYDIAYVKVFFIPLTVPSRRYVMSKARNAESMAQVTWKDIIWSGADRERSIKDLLTILKGFGPMEILHFEKPACYRGELSLWLDEQGVKHITLFYLEVLTDKHHGVGRGALQHLRKIFGGDVYVQDPGEIRAAREIEGGIHVRQPNRDSALFWIQMFEERLIQSVEGDLMNLDEATTTGELETMRREFARGPGEVLALSPDTPSFPEKNARSKRQHT